MTMDRTRERIRKIEAALRREHDDLLAKRAKIAALTPPEKIRWNPEPLALPGQSHASFDVRERAAATEAKRREATAEADLKAYEDRWQIMDLLALPAS